MSGIVSDFHIDERKYDHGWNITKVIVETHKTCSKDSDEDYDFDPYDTGICVLLSIKHKVDTSLNEVGLQVWRASLLLCDYILSHADDFGGVTVLELGAGLGLPSIVAGMIAKKVVVTDVSNEIVAAASDNMKANAQAIAAVREYLGPMDRSLCEWQYSCLDWRTDDFPGQGRVDIVLAADVLYDSASTAALVSLVCRGFHTCRLSTLLLVIENRHVFTLESLSTYAPATAQFWDLLSEESLASGLALSCYQVTQKTIPQILRDYQRTGDMELWKIQMRTL